MINHSLSDVRSQLRDLKRRLVAAMTDEQRFYQRYTEASREADRWRARAELAVGRGLDDLARGALERSGRHASRAAELHREYLDQKEYVERMKVRLLDLEIEARRRPTVALDVPRLERNLVHLERWADRAREERARLAALAELERDELAEEMAALEREDLLERQLEELKARLKRESA